MRRFIIGYLFYIKNRICVLKNMTPKKRKKAQHCLSVRASACLHQKEEAHHPLPASHYFSVPSSQEAGSESRSETWQTSLCFFLLNSCDHTESEKQGTPFQERFPRSPHNRNSGDRKFSGGELNTRDQQDVPKFVSSVLPVSDDRIQSR